MESLLGQYKLDNLIKLAKKTPDGCVIELGVYKGGTLKALAEEFPKRHLFGFDTFEGMPSEFYNETEGHGPGDFPVVYEEVREFLSPFNNVQLIKGVFPESMSNFPYSVNYLTHAFKNISFIHMDMDHGEPTRIALEMFWDKMVPKGIILFDDYDWHACRNIKPVVDAFAEKHGLTVHKLTEHQAYVVKDL